FIDEFEGYKEQLEEPYLLVREFDDSLLNEAYDRMKYDVKVSHILIKVEGSAPPEDTLHAYNKAMEIRERIINGEDFEKVARATSDDPSVKRNGGDLGFFTVFIYPYAFESAAYNQEVGDVSMPVKTRYGYHLIKTTDKREGKGSAKVAHIMVMVPYESSEDSVARARKRIEEIYKKLQDGEDFTELAKNYSDDKRSGRKGGEMRMFTVGKMVPEFEEASFALENPGDVSDIVQTAYGFHIIKLIEKQPIPTFKEVKDDLRKKIDRDVRSANREIYFINSLKKEYNFEEFPEVKEDFYNYVDSTIYQELKNYKIDAELNKVMFKFDTVEVLQSDFYEFMLNNVYKKPIVSIPALIDGVYDRFVTQTLKEYERSILPYKYPDFKYLLEEYHDGILLFELTDQMVWSKAVEDTIGLKEFYNKNKNNYLWPDRVLASKFICNNKETADKVMELLIKNQKKKKMSDEQILNKINSDTTLLSIETGKFAKGQDQIIDSLKWEKSISSIIEKDDEFIIVQIKDLVKPEPKSLQESRGLVIADYQEYLEEKWIQELRNKYTIEINQEVLATIKN
ncbi:MAG: peptidylprolyl isomerase, partial [Bacteroidales bacterium]|nr:peptidylprolyl isomerase [Bacteroidales bacterium]